MKKLFLLALLSALLFLVLPALSEDGSELTVVVTLNKSTVAVDLEETVSATCIATGGEEPYAYEFTWGYLKEDGESIPVDNVAVSYEASSTFNPTFGTKGYVYVEVTDANLSRNGNASAKFDITGSPQTEPLTITIKHYTPTVAADKGESFSADWEASGGSGNFEYWHRFEIPGENGYSSYFEGNNGTTASFAPKWGQEGTLIITVTDSDGERYDEWVHFTISGAPTAPPLLLESGLNKTTVAAGDAITASLEATGGVKPYSYNYKWSVRNGEGTYYRDQSGTTTDMTSEYYPRLGSSGQLSVWVTDSQGRIAHTEDEFFTITGAPEITPPVLLSLKLDKDTVAIGDTITVSWEVTDSVGVFILCQWYIAEEMGGEMEMVKHEVVVYSSGETSSSLTVSHGAEGGLAFMVGSYYRPIIGPEELFFTITDDKPAAVSGDANNDGAIDILDLVSIIDYIVSNTSPTSPTNADANGDGVVDILDLVWIIDRIVGS